MFAKFNLKIVFFFLLCQSVFAQFHIDFKYDPFQPPNTYRSEQNPYYWGNRLPFPGYSQQDIHYSIDAQLNEEQDLLVARQQMTYHNNSIDNIKELYFSILPNAFVAQSPFNIHRTYYGKDTLIYGQAPLLNTT